MSLDFQNDPELRKLVEARAFPTITAIAAVARAKGISQVPAFWRFFEEIREAWMWKKQQYVETTVE